jgi:hypothetical protein
MSLVAGVNTSCAGSADVRLLLRQREVPLSSLKGRVRVKVWRTWTLVALGVGSWVVISKVQVPVLPAASVALQVTGVVPMGKAAPLGGVQVVVGLGLQLSVEVTL